jgi:acetolactate synthase-1/2/3 large subunit
VLNQQQKTIYNGRIIASELENPSFARLAEACRANGAEVNSLKELVPALESALKSDTLTVIDVHTPNGMESFG